MATPSSPSKKTVFLRRASSTLGLWIVVALAFASRHPIAYLGLIAVLALVALVEYHRMLKKADIHAFPTFGLATGALYLTLLFLQLLHQISLPPSWEAACFFLTTAGAFTLQLRRPIHRLDALQSVAFHTLGFAYIPFLFGFAAKLTFLPHPSTAAAGWENVPGAILLLWMIAVTKFTDMGAYLTGSLIGRHKMIPHVSPGKTWEGFGGALAFALLAGIGLYALVPSLAILGSWIHVAGISLVLALLAVIGDLAESIVKRSLQAKDSGTFLPGIGGSLDLIDSLCFTAPALYFYLQWTAR